MKRTHARLDGVQTIPCVSFKTYWFAMKGTVSVSRWIVIPTGIQVAAENHSILAFREWVGCWQMGDRKILLTRQGQRLQFANLEMAIWFVDSRIKDGGFSIAMSTRG